jgi:hypothetical protein
MISRTYRPTDGEGIDSLEANRVRQRFEQALNAARPSRLALIDCSSLVATMLRRDAPADLSLDQWRPSNKGSAGSDDDVMAVAIGYDAQHQLNVPTIDFQPGYDCLGLRLFKSVGSLTSSHVAPGTHIPEVLAILNPPA